MVATFTVIGALILYAWLQHIFLIRMLPDEFAFLEKTLPKPPDDTPPN